MTANSSHDLTTQAYRFRFADLSKFADREFDTPLQCAATNCERLLVDAFVTAGSSAHMAMSLAGRHETVYCSGLHAVDGDPSNHGDGTRQKSQWTFTAYSTADELGSHRITCDNASDRYWYRLKMASAPP